MNLKNIKGNFVERNEAVKTYLESIRHFDSMTMQEEVEAFFNFREYGDKKAMESIINANQRFIFAIAKRYASDETVMDLVQEGNIGLITAMDSYDYTKGTRFLTYAVWFIRREINSYIYNRNLLIRKQNNNKTGNKVSKIKNKYYMENGNIPSEQEIIEILDKEYGIVINEKSDLFEVRIDSLNTCYDDEDKNAFENTPMFTSKAAVDNDFNKDVDAEYNSEVTSALFSCLDEREKEIVMRAFGMGRFNKEYTNYESGEEMGISAERVRQIKNGALKKMKAMMKNINV